MKGQQPESALVEKQYMLEIQQLIQKIDDNVERLQVESKRPPANFRFIFFIASSFVYVGVLISLIMFNYEMSFNSTNPSDGLEINDVLFHEFEFGSFAVYNVCVFIAAFDSSLFEWPLTQYFYLKLLVFAFSLIGIIISTLAFSLIVVDQMYHEKLCHIMEYVTALVLLIGVDCLQLYLSWVNPCSKQHHPKATYESIDDNDDNNKPTTLGISDYLLQFIALVSTLISIIAVISCLISYIHFDDEITAHFIEFSLDILTTFATAVVMGISLTKQQRASYNNINHNNHNNHHHHHIMVNSASQDNLGE